MGVDEAVRAERQSQTCHRMITVPSLVSQHNSGQISTSQECPGTPGRGQRLGLPRSACWIVMDALYVDVNGEASCLHGE